MWIVILGLVGGMLPNLLIPVFFLLLLLSGGGGGGIAPIAPPKFGFFIVTSLVGSIIGIAVEAVRFQRANNDAAKRQNIIRWSGVSLFILALVYYPHLVNYWKIRDWKQVISKAEKAGLVFDYVSRKSGYGFSDSASLMPAADGSFFAFSKTAELRLGNFSAPILKFSPQGKLIPEFSNKLKAGLPKTPEYEVRIADIKGDLMLVPARMTGYVVRTDGTVINKIPYHRASALYKDGSVLWAVGPHDTQDAKSLAVKISPPDGVEGFRVSFENLKSSETEEITPLYIHIFDDDSAVIAAQTRPALVYDASRGAAVLIHPSPHMWSEDGLLFIGISATGDMVWQGRVGNAPKDGQFKVSGVSRQLVALDYIDHSINRRRLVLSSQGLLSENELNEEDRAKLFTKADPVRSVEIEAKLASIPNCCEQRIILPDGSVVATGRFTVEEGDYRSFNIVKILPFGKIDTTFLVEDTERLAGSIRHAHSSPRPNNLYSR